MTDIDIINLYQKWVELDRELKLLKQEVGEMKWYQKHGTTDAAAYSATTAKKQWLPQWEEGLSDNEQWDEENK